MSNQTTKGNKVIRTIKDKDGRVIGEVNENTYLIDIQKACPTFFKPFDKNKCLSVPKLTSPRRDIKISIGNSTQLYQSKDDIYNIL